jgi:ribosomal protein S27E
MESKSINCNSCGAGLNKSFGYCNCSYCGNTNLISTDGKTKITENEKYVNMPRLSGKNVAPTIIKTAMYVFVPMLILTIMARKKF